MSGLKSFPEGASRRDSYGLSKILLQECDKDKVISRFASAAVRSMKIHATRQSQETQGCTEEPSLFNFSAHSSEITTTQTCLRATQGNLEKEVAATPYVLSSFARFVPFYQLAIKEIIAESEKRIAHAAVTGAPPSMDGSVNTKVFDGEPLNDLFEGGSGISTSSGQPNPKRTMLSPCSLVSLDSQSCGAAPLWPKDSMRALLNELGRHIRNQDIAPLVFTAALVYLSRIVRRAVNDVDGVTDHNWFRLTTISILVAFKMFNEGEGLSRANRNFSASSNIPLMELNRLEVDFLYLIDFDLLLEEGDLVCWITWMERLAYRAGMVTPLHTFMCAVPTSAVTSTIAYSCSSVPEAADPLCYCGAGHPSTICSSHTQYHRSGASRDALGKTESCTSPTRPCTGIDFFGSIYSSNTVGDEDSHLHDVLTHSAAPPHSTSPSESLLGDRFNCFSPVQEVTANMEGERLFSLVHKPPSHPVGRNFSISLKHLSQLGSSPAAPPLPPTASPLGFMKAHAPTQRRPAQGGKPYETSSRLHVDPPARESATEPASAKPAETPAAPEVKSVPAASAGPFRKFVGRFREVVHLTSALARGRLNVLSTPSHGALEEDELPSVSNSPVSLHDFGVLPEEAISFSSVQPLSPTPNRDGNELGAVQEPGCLQRCCYEGDLEQEGKREELEQFDEYEQYGYDNYDGNYDENYENYDEYDEYDDYEEESPYIRQPPRTHSPPCIG